jgi:tRNA(fMet)-specific endonuclease VapC
VGIVLDTTVFVDLERQARATRRADLGVLLSERLAAAVGEDEEVAIATITASELLHGVHRASPEHRGRREAFVETVLSVIPALPFDLLTARVHARLWADLAAAGSDVGAHDRIVAATAISSGWSVATSNLRHFHRIPGLQVWELS